MVVTMPEELKAIPRLVEEDKNSDDLATGLQASYSPIGSIQHSLSGMSGMHGLPPMMPRRGSSSLSNTKGPTGSSSVLNRPTFTAQVMPPGRTTTTTTTTTPTTTRPTTSRTTTKQSNNRRAKTSPPSLFVKIRGLTLPLCMNLDLQDSEQYSLFNITSSGAYLALSASNVGKGRRRKSVFTSVTYQTSRPRSVPQMTRPDVTRDDGEILLEDSQGDVDFYVIQKLDRRLNYLQISLEMPSKRLRDLDGLLDIFNGMRAKLVRQVTRKRKIIGKIKLRKGSMKTRIRALEYQNPLDSLNSCWLVNKASMRKLYIDVSKYRL